VEIIDGSLYYQFLVGPNAFSAKDTFRKIPANKGVDLLGSSVVGQLVEFQCADTQFGGDLPELAEVPLVA
jgi:hypothetical protein